jgi:hypothetical protein
MRQNNHPSNVSFNENMGPFMHENKEVLYRSPHFAPTKMFLWIF